MNTDFLIIVIVCAAVALVGGVKIADGVRARSAPRALTALGVTVMILGALSSFLGHPPFSVAAIAVGMMACLVGAIMRLVEEWWRELTLYGAGAPKRRMLAPAGLLATIVACLVGGVAVGVNVLTMAWLNSLSRTARSIDQAGVALPPSVGQSFSQEIATVMSVQMFAIGGGFLGVIATFVVVLLIQSGRRHRAQVSWLADVEAWIESLSPDEVETIHNDVGHVGDRWPGWRAVTQRFAQTSERERESV